MGGVGFRGYTGGTCRLKESAGCMRVSPRGGPLLWVQVVPPPASPFINPNVPK